MGYAAKDLQVLEGLDAVRLRPGMYIGGTGNKGLHHILWEIVDNAIDEVANGFANQISVKLYPDGSASVEDNGRGIPVDKHPKLEISGVELVFTKLHAGGKFENSNYTFSGGLHGVGASVTNALSRWLHVEVFKEGKVYTQEFASIEIDGKIRSGIPQTQLTESYSSDGKKKGTFVRFLPDDRVFVNESFDGEIIMRRLKELAYLNKGAKFSFEDQREGGKKRNFSFAGGIKDLVTDVNSQKKLLYPEPIYVYYQAKNFQVEFSFQNNDSYTDSLITFVNNIPTTEGGTHVTGMKSAYTRVMNEYARKRGLLKDKDDNLLGDDYWEGLTAVLSVRMQNTQFEGQTKTKLGNPEARTLVENAIYEKLTEEINKPSSYTTADAIIKKAQDAAKVRETTKKSKELARKKNSINNSTLIGKLAGCSGRDYSKRELFIVEGDSAGGSAKQGRDRSFQAILPLRGKPLNTYGLTKKVVYENEEFNLLQAALNIEDGIDGLRYNKVIVATDADVDGMHIRLLMITFFLQFFPELVKKGHVQILQTPLFRVRNRKKRIKKPILEAYQKEHPDDKGDFITIYCYSEDERVNAIQALSPEPEITRFKGLGEISPEEFKNFIGPDMRLEQVTLKKTDKVQELLEYYMGKNTMERQIFIINNLVFEEDKPEADTEMTEEE